MNFVRKLIEKLATETMNSMNISQNCRTGRSVKMIAKQMFLMIHDNLHTIQMYIVLQMV